MLWCERVAPLGKPVVPDVYWMLIGSSADSSIASRAAFLTERSAYFPVSSSSRQASESSRTTCYRSGHRGRTSAIIAA